MSLALRRLRRNRGANLATVVILAVGISLLLALYSSLDALILHPLHYPNSDRLIEVWETGQFNDGQVSSEIYPQGPALAAVRAVMPTGTQAAMAAPGGGRVARGGLSRYAHFASVTPQFFAVFAVAPQLGRALLPRDFHLGAPPVAVISTRLWEQYGKSGGIVGSTLILGGTARTVVGVMPAALQWPGPDCQLWIPMQKVLPGSLVARLPAGLSLISAQALVAAAGARVAAAARARLRLTRAGLRAVRLQDPTLLLAGHQREQTSLLALVAAAALLLALVLTNLASLWAARAIQRREEHATLLALGAGPARLVLAVALEALAVAACGCGLGLGCAALLLGLLHAAAPTGASYLQVVEFGTPACWLSAGLTVAASLALATTPACMIWRQARGSGHAVQPHGQPTWSRGWLLAVEVAAALALVAGATLSLQTLARQAGGPAGYRPESATQTALFFPPSPDSTRAFARRLQSARRFLSRLRAAPGIEAAGLADSGPFETDGGPGVLAGTHPGALPAEAPVVHTLQISSGYFQALGVPLRGRGFTANDAVTAGRTLVPAIINVAFAQEFFPNRPAMGQIFSIGAPYLEVVVGIAGNVQPARVAAPIALYYAPWAGVDDSAELEIRSATSAATISATLQRLSVGTGLTFGPTQTLAEVRSARLGGSRFRSALLALFAGLAVMLGLLGIYAFASLSCAQRAREFAIRAAVGASPRSIGMLVIRSSAGWLAIGAVAGCAGAWALQRLLASVLWRFEASTWEVLLAAALACALAGTLALMAPAARAARADPAAILKEN